MCDHRFARVNEGGPVNDIERKPFGLLTFLLPCQTNTL